MYLLGKHVDSITESDILRLIENQIKESTSLDYKRELHNNQREQIKEFLFDVAAFVNTDGGCLVYGVEELKDNANQNTGIPEKIVGITIENHDKETQRIEDQIRTNTDPAITGIAIKIVNTPSGAVLILGLRKGLGLPTMVTYNNSNKFFRRKNTGKYLVATHELNQMFMQHQFLRDKLEAIRKERFSVVRDGIVFPALNKEVFFLLQIIPSSFQNDTTIDISSCIENGLVKKMSPIGPNNYSYLFNVDGFATFQSTINPPIITAYDQLCRNGIYESYTCQLFTDMPINQKSRFYYLHGDEFMSCVIEKITSILEILKYFQLEPPFYVCLSLYGIKGGNIINSGAHHVGAKFPTNPLFLPIVMLESYQSNKLDTLKPVFDILWQSAGFPKAPEMSNFLPK